VVISVLFHQEENGFKKKTLQCWGRQGPGRGIAMFIAHHVLPIGTDRSMYHKANNSELYPSAIHGISQLQSGAPLIAKSVYNSNSL
jgi:hypothetical protein